MTMPQLCVSSTQALGWCDYKVAEVVRAVAEEPDEVLHEVLVEATLGGGLLKNFLPLPFAAHSSYGRRLTEA